MNADSEAKKGCIAKLSPPFQAVAIICLSAILFASLVCIDREGLATEWQTKPLELIERFLNIYVQAGTIWIVLLERDAVLAALAKVIGQSITTFMSKIAESMAKAGADATVIARALKDFSSNWTTNASDDKSKTNTSRATVSQDTASRPPVTAKSAMVADTTPIPGMPRRPWQAWALCALWGAFVLFAVWHLQKRPSELLVPQSGPHKKGPHAEVSEGHWLKASGSVSKTLEQCLGKPPGRAREQAVADLNHVTCTEPNGVLRCLVTEGRALRLPKDIACRAGAAVFESEDAASKAL